MMVELFGDKNGNISSMNFVWLISIVTIIGMWIAISFRLNSLQHVTGGDALWFATLFSGKVLQNFFERRMPKPDDVDPQSNMFQDNQGKTSVSRVVWVVAVLGIVFTWAFISWTSIELQHFTTGDAAWFAGLFGSKIGGTIIERDFGIKSEDDDYGYRGLGGDVGDGDGIPTDYSQSGYMGGGGETDISKDSLIKQLQETIKVQNQFNKNLVRSIDPTMNKSINDIEDSEKREALENKENFIRNSGEDV